MTLQNCALCGSSDLQLRRVPTELRMGERKATVTAEHYACASCGEGVVTPEQMRAAQVALVAELRRQDDLLSPADIKAIRTDLGLTQSQLETVLGVAPKTAVRWERGTVCQSRAVDQVLRLLQAVPGTLDFLAERAGGRVFTSSPRSGATGATGWTASGSINYREPFTRVREHQKLHLRSQSIGPGAGHADGSPHSAKYKGAA